MSENSATAASGGRARRFAAAALTLPLAVSGLLAAGAAQAHADSGGGIAVSMGDSYISGEAGRWAGNSDTITGSRDGTDRAWNGSSYNASSVYGATAGGCDRSDSAEAISAFGSAGAVNIACSGATTADVFRASSGGQTYKGEAPQADQLAAIAAQQRVGLVALSIGGNDLGFADAISACIKDYEVWYSYCNATEQSAVDSKIDSAMTNVGKAIDEVRAVMTADGYADSDYRIVLQSYPSPIPRSSEDRYPESGWSRTMTGGCPFWNADLDWARDQLIPQLAQRLGQVAAGHGAQFLDLQDFLQGHEVCSTSDSLATDDQPTDAASGEWARFLTTGATQGTVQESFHPNYYGELGLGRCLSLVAAEPAGQNFACRSTPGQDASGVYLNPLS
ncbi:GDSL-type esterase/lipase family protein [Kitasatospora viridis]|uniref:GDSL-like lipase/acylhydrolase family protein n=1 Tax=Kitasatospora viridis TaxID=281105 RepID=A0A561SDQ6_9ACTN|nr:GDSL-type esterase/lipase family protein [Kitasatospora viridis]TWF72965.1 GDSL-like lipase/acylhydrolase family protein [Kitasatospora viridis]